MLEFYLFILNKLKHYSLESGDCNLTDLLKEMK